MGNALRFLYGQCCKPSADSDFIGHHGISTNVSTLAQDIYNFEISSQFQSLNLSDDLIGHHGISTNVSTLAQDIYNFEISSQVPQGLSKHVVHSKKAQANWYKKLSDAWRENKPPPRTPEEASRLVIQTLKGHQKADVEGLLAYYGLPLPHELVDISTGAHPSQPHAVEISTGGPSSQPHGLKFELHTLPVDVKAVADGDTVTVYVRETANVPKEVQVAAAKRAKARSVRNYEVADELHKKIIAAGYRVLNIQNEEVLAKKYRIRLRGIDTPESKMPYGQKAKEELTNIVQDKCLIVQVFDQDRYGRCVGDIYCNGVFVQELMLKKGLAWHYKAYDKRAELDKWEEEARRKRVGLWASSNPEMPWEWRKNKREGR